jgi:hypothetical protein
MSGKAPKSDGRDLSARMIAAGLGEVDEAGFRKIIQWAKKQR